MTLVSSGVSNWLFLHRIIFLYHDTLGPLSSLPLVTRPSSILPQFRQVALSASSTA